MPAVSNMARAELTAESRRTIAKLARSDAMPALRKKMRSATSPLQPAVRRAARQTPSTHSRYKAVERGGSLRSAISNTIQRKFKFSGKSVTVIIKQVPSGGKSNLANVLEGTLPWNHPTYGHKPEVTQDPHPFFFETIQKLEPAVNREVEKVLTEFERTLL